MFVFTKKQRALNEIDRRRNQESTYLEQLPKDAPDLKEFLNMFYREILFKRQAEMKEELFAYPESTGRLYKKLVPDVIAYEDFWQRYYYRTGSVERVIRELEQQDAEIRKARTDALRESWNSATHNMQSVLNTASQNLAAAVGEIPGSPLTSPNTATKRPSPPGSSPLHSEPKRLVTQSDASPALDPVRTKPKPAKDPKIAPTEKAVLVGIESTPVTETPAEQMTKDDDDDKQAATHSVKETEEGPVDPPGLMDKTIETKKAFPMETLKTSVEKQESKKQTVEEALVSRKQTETAVQPTISEDLSFTEKPKKVVEVDKEEVTPEAAAIKAETTASSVPSHSVPKPHEEDSLLSRENQEDRQISTNNVGRPENASKKDSNVASRNESNIGTRAEELLDDGVAKSGATQAIGESSSATQPIAKKGSIDLLAQAEIDAGTGRPVTDTAKPTEKGKVDPFQRSEAGAKKSVSPGGQETDRAGERFDSKKEMTKRLEKKGKVDLLMQAEIDAGMISAPAPSSDAQEERLNPIPSPKSVPKKSNIDWKALRAKRISRIRSSATEADESNSGQMNTEKETIITSDTANMSDMDKKEANPADDSERTDVATSAVNALGNLTSWMTSQAAGPTMVSPQAVDSLSVQEVPEETLSALTSEATEKIKPKSSSLFDVFKTSRTETENSALIRQAEEIQARSDIVTGSEIVNVSNYDAARDDDRTDPSKGLFASIFTGSSSIKSKDEYIDNKDQADVTMTETSSQEPTPSKMMLSTQTFSDETDKEAKTKNPSKGVFGSMFKSSTAVTDEQSTTDKKATTNATMHERIDSKEATPDKNDVTTKSDQVKGKENKSSRSGRFFFRKKSKDAPSKDTVSAFSKPETAKKSVQEANSVVDPPSKSGLWRRKHKTTKKSEARAVVKSDRPPVETKAKKSVAAMIEKFDKKTVTPTAETAQSSIGTTSVLLSLLVIVVVSFACIPVLLPGFCMSVMDGLCAPIAPFLKLSEAFEGEAPWWASTPKKAYWFSSLCGEDRKRTILTLEQQKGDFFTLTFAAVDSPKRALLKKRVRKIENSGSKILLWMDDENYESVPAPWSTKQHS